MKSKSQKSAKMFLIRGDKAGNIFQKLSETGQSSGASQGSEQFRKLAKCVFQFSIMACIVAAVLMLPEWVFAQFGSLEGISETIGLPGSTATHGKSSAEPGVAEITSIIFTVMDFIKYMVGTIAVVIMVVSGVRLVSAGKEVEKISESQKNNIKYGLVALLIVFLADVVVEQIFFGQYGDVFESEATAKQYAQQGSLVIEGVYGLMTKFIAAFAILMIVISGIGIAASGGNEEGIKKHRNRILWALGGLFLAGIAEFIIKDVIFPQQGAVLPNIEKAKLLIVKITNFISGFISTIAVLAILYAGFLYVTGVTNEDNTNKAKKIIAGAVIGILIALGAFALVNTVIKFEKRDGIIKPIGPQPGQVLK